MSYLVIDAEMGGIGLQYSLLQCCFLVCNESLEIVDKLVFHLKPDDETYVVNGKALEVNKINLVEHDKIAITYKSAKPILYDFLSKNAGSGNFLTPVGHGVAGDISHIASKIISMNSWHNFCSYNYIDTGVIYQFFKTIFKIPPEINGNLESIGKFFNVEPDGVLHTAETDCKLTLEVFKKMIGK